MSIHPYKNTIRAVRVTAADYNGHTFDGSPFSFATVPGWLVDALEHKKIRGVNIGCTDYLVWEVDVKDPDGDVRVWIANPGDYIVLDVKDRLSVVTGTIFDTYFVTAEVPTIAS